MMLALRFAIAPLETRARLAIARSFQQFLDLILHSRTFLHMLLVGHLTWLTERLAEPGDAFQQDPRQYEYFIARGGEPEWTMVFLIGALLGLVGLIIGKRWSRVAGAFAMGTIELVIANGLTSSHAAPTAEPTYGVLVIMSCWLILSHWLPKRGTEPRQ